jgi:putative ABC transport system substrate-binding protein
MRRREVIGLLGSAASWPLAARAQQSSMPVIGFLAGANADVPGSRTGQAFRQGLSETGYVLGQNVLIEGRGGTSRYEELPVLARELIRHPVSIFVTTGVQATMVVKASGTTIPCVFYMGGDPIDLGLVGSLNRPGGNFTGVALLNTELAPKRLELLRELLPGTRSFALLVNPANSNVEDQTQEVQAAARMLNVQLHVLRASSERDFDAVFSSIAELKIGGLVVGADGVFVRHREKLGELTAQHRVPAVFQFPEFVVAGGLVSYGSSLAEAHRQVGIYAGRVLKGEKPADLPVQQATKFEMTINLKAAKALGISIPLPLIGRADEVID